MTAAALAGSARPAAQARGQRIVGTSRRAPSICCSTLESGTLLLHLGMSGNLRVLPADTPRLRTITSTWCWTRAPRCASTTRAASAASSTRAVTRAQHPLLAAARARALRCRVRRRLPVAHHATPARRGQAAAHEQPAWWSESATSTPARRCFARASGRAARRAVSPRPEAAQPRARGARGAHPAIRAGGTTLRDYLRRRRRTGLLPPAAVRLRARRQALPALRHAGARTHAGAALDVLLPDLSEVISP